MGSVMSLINTTPDGFVDAQYTIADDAFYAFSNELLSKTKTIAFGRNTFELFQRRWPPILEDVNVSAQKTNMAKALNVKQKDVYSSSLKITAWDNATVIRNIDAAYINSYKKEGEGGMLTLGSPTLVAELTALNLIDDYYFFVQPFLAGAGANGIRLFDALKLDKCIKLKYADSKQLNSGVHIIHYACER